MQIPTGRLPAFDLAERTNDPGDVHPLIGFRRVDEVAQDERACVRWIAAQIEDDALGGSERRQRRRQRGRGYPCEVNVLKPWIPFFNRLRPRFAHGLCGVAWHDNVAWRSSREPKSQCDSSVAGAELHLDH